MACRWLRSHGAIWGAVAVCGAVGLLIVGVMEYSCVSRIWEFRKTHLMEHGVDVRMTRHFINDLASFRKTDNARLVRANETALPLRGIHLASVIGSSAEHLRQWMSLVQSVLLTTNPVSTSGKLRNMLHFHMILDSNHTFIAQQLRVRILNGSVPGAGWPPELVQIHIHDGTRLLVDSPVPNHHYSGQWGMLKLQVEVILDQSIQRVLVLDTDTLVFGPLDHVWERIDSFSAHQRLGMVAEQSEFYRDTTPTEAGGEKYRWPHVKHGFNSGVLLLDLGKLRCRATSRASPDSRAGCRPWRELWRTSLRDVYEKHPSWTLQVGDQDVFNTAVARYPEVLAELPCNWNLQDSGLRREFHLCSPENSETEIYHFNLYAKRYGFFRGVRAAFANSMLHDAQWWQQQWELVNRPT